MATSRSINFKPLHDLLVVKRAEAMIVTAGGIRIPDRAQQTSPDGVVVAVSDGYWDKAGNWLELRVKVGDRVRFMHGAGIELVLDGINDGLILMHEVEVLGILGPAKDQPVEQLAMA